MKKLILSVVVAAILPGCGGSSSGGSDGDLPGEPVKHGWVEVEGMDGTFEKYENGVFVADCNIADHVGQPVDKSCVNRYEVETASYPFDDFARITMYSKDHSEYIYTSNYKEIRNHGTDKRWQHGESTATNWDLIDVTFDQYSINMPFVDIRLYGYEKIPGGGSKHNYEDISRCYQSSGVYECVRKKGAPLCADIPENAMSSLISLPTRAALENDAAYQFKELLIRYNVSC